MQIPTLTGAQTGRIISEKNGRILIKERFFYAYFLRWSHLYSNSLFFYFAFYR